MVFEELKQRHGAMWGSGPYERITETIADVHELVVERLAPQPGERWLDLACGTGAVSERAARVGAKVTGIDLAPVLVETAKRRAREHGLEIDYRVGDCERLDGVADATFDVLSSTFGIMFAPDHEATARQLARVLRPAARIGLANWEPEGGVGEMFRMMSPFQPEPPPSSPFEWGREERVRELLGNAFDLVFEHRTSTFRVGSGQEYWDLFASSYGPTKALARSLPDDRREELQRTWIDFFETRYRTNGGIEHPREYLLVLGTRR
jgi:SAM-dependent methyltransferase